MYNNQGIDERTRPEQDLNESPTGRNFYPNFSPKMDLKYIANNRYCPSSSQSFPRRSKSIQTFRPNRSLNFDSSSHRNDHSKFKSPSSTFSQFSRSAKIMRALNFSNCPISAKKKSISKVLNFDVPSLSPKNLNTPGSSSTSPASLDLHLSISSHGSNYSGLGNSVESMDENQNRTPLNSKKSAKKALKFHNPMTPQSNEGILQRHSIFSPGLRQELRKKIDDIVGSTPLAHHSVKKTQDKSASIYETSATSRNLFFDFQKETEDPLLVPSTPKNQNRPVPESMSAIKKSHKKERLCRRLHESLNSVEKVSDMTKLVVEAEGNTVKTPKSISRSFPPYLVDSIKRSHKKEKDKSKVNLLTYASDPEILSEPDSLPEDKEEEEILISKSFEKCEQSNSQGKEENKKEELLSPAWVETPKISRAERSSTPMTTRSMTPKNNVNILEHLAVSSIKKSHKKNKTLFRSKSLDFSSETVTLENGADENAQSRSATPDVLNSSRILIDNFESVKKSHRKEKKNKSLRKFTKLENEPNSSFLRNDSVVDDDFAPLSNYLDIPPVGSALQKKMKNSDLESVLNLSGSDDGFKIFTPLRKKRIQVPKELCRAEVSVERCDTPISTLNFVNTTPENRSTIELVNEIGRSIKKSHRKEKLTARQKLSYMQQLADNYEDGPQASTSEDMSTPPQNPTMKNLIRNVYNSSIKKSHQKERQKRKISCTQEETGISLLDGGSSKSNFQEQMSSNEEENLSDDGSIFNYSDKLQSMKEME